MPDLSAFDIAYRAARLTEGLDEGFRDALSFGRVLTVDMGRGAADVIRQAASMQAEVVVVVDPADAVVGFVIPDWIKRQVERNLKLGPVSLAESIEALSRQVPEPGRIHHFHEWLNFQRPEGNICPGRQPEPPHYTLGPAPCSRHR